MFYLILLVCALFVLFKSFQAPRTGNLILAGATLILIFLWVRYLGWSNPSGDPHGSMFRGIDLLALWILTGLVALAAVVQFRRKPRKSAED